MLLVLLTFAVSALNGCASAVRWGDPSTRKPSRTSRPAVVPDTHTVKTGESLYAIALRYDLAANDLARWNRLGSGELIFPGQTLRLRAPSVAQSPPVTRRPTAPIAPPVAPPRFVWPADGAISSAFTDPASVGKGIDIKGKKGNQVRAAAAGRVVYSGDGLIGYGNLLIVKHNERFLTAYGYNDSLLVKEGDQVRAGQTIARMGRGPDRRALLHFEIRERGKPVDPQRYLPRK